jgi:ectoine hydroxylase-related dioxygenase (phytanoyl-CoA dioxygenase family)
MIDKHGYQKVSLLNSTDINYLINKITHKLNSVQKIKKLNQKNLNSFHKINFEDDHYKKIIQTKNRNFSLDPNFLRKKIVKSKISKILKKIWGHDKFNIVWIGSSNKKEIKFNRAGFRIARPKKKSDVAEEHIDAYNDKENYFFTIWVPLIGFNKKYSLKIYPKTHKLDHSKNIKKYNKKNSRLFKEGYLGKFNEKRFSLKKGSAIIFNQNLIHGGAINNGSKTRVSIEIRIFNKKIFNKKELFRKNI